jgi:alkanesulfonate monooxygenase
MQAVTTNYTRVELFSTCPPSNAMPGDVYRERLVEVARWSEAAGCSGSLIYTDNGMLDPWLVSQALIEATDRLCPLVAVQPVYMHPYSVAKLVASLGSLYGRRLHLNMVSGGFKNDLLALNDQTPHDKRYVRLEEYTTIVRRLLEGRVTSLAGEFYRVDRLRLAPRLPAELLPGIFVSGSSPAGLAAAAAMDATAVKYPKPAAEEGGFPASVTRRALRVGIIARDREEDAWRAAHERFPGDRKGQLTHQLAMKVSDSVWHKQLSDMAEAEASPYWLFPFQNYKTMCPYLVGSHARVAEELCRYLGMGVTRFIVDVPVSPAELEHTVEAFRTSLAQVA